MLCIALDSVIGNNLSILFSILVAFVLDVLLYTIRDYFDFNKKYETDFTKYGLSDMMAGIAYEWKVEHLTRQEQADKYGLAINTIRTYRHRIAKKLK